MTYEQAIQYLYTQLPMYSKIGQAAYKADLKNIIALCSSLGNPQKSFKSIHIAGTNGKGSCSHMLAAILQQSGLKTGLYTSPHVKAFGERIRINGKMIDQNFVVEFTEKTKLLCKDIQPSFFELTVAMAFDFFAKEKIDIAIIETGLGGRLDSTNIIWPILSIITNIGYDHMNILGDTLSQIAFEKAGIIKSNIPVVIGATNNETQSVFLRKAHNESAPIYFSEEIYTCTDARMINHQLHCNIIENDSGKNMIYQLDLSGLYQSKNLCTVLTAIKVLDKIGFSIENNHVQSALQQVKKITGLKGRWEIVSKNPLIVYDVAHNKDGIQEVLNQIKHFHSEALLHFILGFVNDKDISGILDMLPKHASYYFTNAHIPRALAHDELKKRAAEKKIIGESYDDVNDAIIAAKSIAKDTDLIIVCGSFFLIGEVDSSNFDQVD
ncbi:MAG: bifunctional folylpolyglutamate synthase/dihydrofolate synthase [Ferruginibacter sp.]|nr:bifunctional folylpolyglutamate synthase/dihydrofolate synthase [Ferruginibacter sp.]